MYIGSYTFYYCSSLVSISLPNTVASIENSNFERCTSLTSIIVPNSVLSIGSSAFYYCSSVTSITIPNTVTSIGDLAFRNCSHLTDVYYIGTPSNWNTISISYGNENLISAVRHYRPSDFTDLEWHLNDDGVLLISGSGYMNDYDVSSNHSAPWYSSDSLIRKVVIQTGVLSIGNYAFYSSYSLASITIPGSLTWIGDYAFGYCDSVLAEYHGTEQQWNDIHMGYNNSALTRNTVDDHGFFYTDLDMQTIIVIVFVVVFVLALLVLAVIIAVYVWRKKNQHGGYEKLVLVPYTSEEEEGREELEFIQTEMVYVPELTSSE